MFARTRYLITPSQISIMYRAIFETIIKNMINFYQLILTTDFQKFENFQF
jgi:hypothetical protein